MIWEHVLKKVEKSIQTCAWDTKHNELKRKESKRNIGKKDIYILIVQYSFIDRSYPLGREK